MDKAQHDQYLLIPPGMDLPKLHEINSHADPMVYVKLSTPATPHSSWVWFITAYSPEDRMALGCAVGPETETGPVSIAALERARGPMGEPIQRDVQFTPKPLSQALAEIGIGKYQDHLSRQQEMEEVAEWQR